MDDLQTSAALAPEQRAMLTAKGAAASHWLLVEIDEPLDTERLRAALIAVTRGHSVLASCFRRVEGYTEPRCLIRDETPAPILTEVDWRARDESDPLLWAQRFAANAFALEQGELLRVALLRTATGNALALASAALALDGASLCLLCEQIANTYRGETESETFFQYAQFVEWRNDLLADEGAEEERVYWRDYWRHDVPPPRLAYRCTDSITYSQSVRVTHRLEPEQRRRLLDAADAAGVERSVWLQAVWWLLLARLSDGRRFGGWLHDCRLDYEVMAGALGVFEKVLPVLIDSDSCANFHEWLARYAQLRETHSAAQEYWPVEAPPGDAHLAVGFTRTRCDLPRSWRLCATSGPAGFELALQVLCTGENIDLVLHADPACYSRAALQRLALQFSTLLEQTLDAPASPLTGLSLLGDEERAALLAMNDNAMDFGERCVLAVIADWARTTPDAPALIDETTELSYAALWAQVESAAAWLRAQGLARGALVALNLPRSARLVVAMLAVWRAGGAFLVLEPEWPQARKQTLLENAAPQLVLHGRDGVVPSSWDTPDHLLFEFESHAFSALPPFEPALTDLAYVLYTSGSTGLPKGVVIGQGQLLNYVAAASAALELGASRRWALTSSVAADLGFTALFGALFNGACLVVANADTIRDAESFAQFMTRHAIDGLKIVPSHLEALLECETPYLPEKLVLGGEAAGAGLLERIARLAPHCRVFNHYGPTETTVGVLVHELSVEPFQKAEAAPLSRVLANNRIYVLDEAGQLAPTGVAGELFIGGAQLCRGYWRRPELNAEGGVFIADPFVAGARLYRSGDLAYALPEGGFRLLGRADFQLKIQGLRVEPAEIEAALLMETGVRQAVVLPLAGAEIQLGAYLVIERGIDPEKQIKELRERLQKRLPAFMCPARYFVLEVFPRLANGKVDRQALAGLQESHPSTRAAPRDALDAFLAAMMGRLLGMDAIGIDDDFFELGGHSLLVIKLVARLRKWLRIDVAPAFVFDFPTVRVLADALRPGRDTSLLESLAEAALAQSSAPELEETASA